MNYKSLNRLTRHSTFTLFLLGSICAYSANANEVPNRVSVNGRAVTDYLPLLEITQNRIPTIDPKAKLHVKEVKPNLFFVTDGIYQSAFLNTEEGIVVFDAPSDFGEKLPEIIQQHVPNGEVKYLVYSHGHKDHIGGAIAFKDISGLKVIAHQRVADSLQSRRNPTYLIPTVTFQNSYSLSVGGEEIEMTHQGSFHSADADSFIYLPRMKFLIAVDILSPGYAPFKDFELTLDLDQYIKVLGVLLSYDFDLLLSGHLGFLGTRQDVLDTREYVQDVKATVLSRIRSETPQARLGKASSAMAPQKNSDLAFRYLIESVSKECATEMIQKWKDRLSGVDVWADGHCETMLLYLFMH